MRVVKVLAGLAVALAVLAGLGLFALTRYLGSDAFRQAVVAAARNALGADVHIGELRVSLVSGATLRQVRVASPPGTGEDLLRARALVVRPRLLPLLRRRLEIEEMRLEAPAVTLARTAGGGWAHEPLAARPGAAPGAPGAAPGRVGGLPGIAGPPELDLVVPRLTLSEGSVLVLGERGHRLVQVSGIQVETSLARLAGAMSGEGQLRIASVRLGNRVEVEALVAPLRFHAGEVAVGPLRARLAEGALTGDATFALVGDTRYAASLALADARAETLLGAMGHPSVSGRIRAHARFRGTAAGAAGQGHAEIRDGQLLDFPVLGTLGRALDLPLLRDLRFEEGAVDFTLAGDVLRTPSLRFTARDVRLRGRGEVALRAGTLAHELTLLVPAAAVRRAPRALRAAFTDRGDGLAGLDFRVFGPYRALRTDLEDRVLGSLAESVLRGGLRRLLR